MTDPKSILMKREPAYRIQRTTTGMATPKTSVAERNLVNRD